MPLQGKEIKSSHLSLLRMATTLCDYLMSNKERVYYPAGGCRNPGRVLLPSGLCEGDFGSDIRLQAAASSPRCSLSPCFLLYFC